MPGDSKLRTLKDFRPTDTVSWIAIRVFAVLGVLGAIAVGGRKVILV